MIVYFLFMDNSMERIYVYKTILATVRAERKIILAAVSSSIATLLLPDKRTTHSRFYILIVINENLICEIKSDSHIIKLIINISMIIWDEALMAHRYYFEAINRSLRDILWYIDSENIYKPLGEKVVLLSRDFRQILPIIPKDWKEEIIQASIHKSYL